MTRRSRLPEASELLESTSADVTVATTEGSPGAGSGRQRHTQKITVYLSEEELLDLERARLALRSRYGVAADRGRLVRVAVACALADLDAQGEDAAWLKALRAP